MHHAHAKLGQAPRKAISSTMIWPVLRKATDSRPCWSMMASNFRQKTCMAVSQSTASPFSRGVVARSAA
nr:hypothetical protein [Verrucomicrobium spinosum]